MKTNPIKLEKKLKLKFSDQKIFIKSLTHKSFDSINNNEKIEFLGDRVLGLIIAKKLLELYPDEKEGVLDKKFASLVNKKKCLEIAKKIELEKYILVLNPKNKKIEIEDKIVADCLEALIGAIYLDKGLNFTEKFILNLWSEHITASVITQIDAKTKLQEYSLKIFKVLPIYKLISNTGPRHKPLFKVAVKLKNTKFFTAEGTSKKDAEQNAASLCLQDIFKKMNWDDSAYLVSKNRYSENSIIAEVFTENHGKISGIIFGGTSKKIKNYLQIGNKIYVNYNSKSVTRIGYFKIEILKALTPLYFDQNQKLSCITSAMHLIKLLTAEAQSNKEIFKLIDKFFEILNSENWIQKYIFWELELLKLLGYDLELKTMAEKEIVDSEVNYYVKSSTEKKSIPNFLIDENDMDINLNNLLKGLKLVSDYLEKSILKPNNLNLPTSRTHFINLLK
ncbi:ribonuclease III [Candidatus Pelagibacter ubique]|nr:ribonuclease III [Candidatus Pelagibacter ubique]